MRNGFVGLRGMVPPNDGVIILCWSHRSLTRDLHRQFLHGHRASQPASAIQRFASGIPGSGSRRVAVPLRATDSVVAHWRNSGYFTASSVRRDQDLPRNSVAPRFLHGSAQVFLAPPCFRLPQAGLTDTKSKSTTLERSGPDLR